MHRTAIASAKHGLFSLSSSTHVAHINTSVLKVEPKYCFTVVIDLDGIYKHYYFIIGNAYQTFNK